MEEKAQAVGRRWDYCAEGYDEIIQNEFAEEAEDKWGSLLAEYAPDSRGSVLDIGTGPGFFSVLLGQQGWKVTGIDCSGKMLETAKKNARAAGIDADYYQMDSHKLDFPDNYFDYLVGRNVTWILYNPRIALREWLRVLKPGGRLLYLDANWHISGDPDYQAAIQKDEEEYRRLYGEPENTYRGDERTEKEFQKVLYFNEIQRPQWDMRELPLLGYSNVRIEPRVNERVYDEKKQLLYRSVPLFLVSADKPL